MKRDADRTPHPLPLPQEKPRPRVRRARPAADPGGRRAGATGKNVSPLESGLSMAAGVLFLVGALFPRSIKQLLLARDRRRSGLSRDDRPCGVYAALGIDTAKESLLKQINEKFLAPAAGDASRLSSGRADGIRFPGRVGVPPAAPSILPGAIAAGQPEARVETPRAAAGTPTLPGNRMFQRS